VIEEEKGGRPDRSPVLAEAARRKGWHDTRAGPLLPERARSECARSTAAVGPTRVPCHERSNELAWKEH
jgi:hypothetical protein